MKTLGGRSLFWAVLILTLGFLPDASVAGLYVIGGSASAAPPSFIPTSFWGVTSTIDRAFPFTVPSGGPFEVEQLQVALYHYSNLAGDQAAFTINSDSSGAPGAALSTFQVSGISTTAQVMNAAPQASTILQSGATYWLVGATPYGQVNWNLDQSALGTAATRVSGGAWTFQSNTSISAFVILGSPVPEPMSLWLFGIAGLAMRRRWR